MAFIGTFYEVGELPSPGSFPHLDVHGRTPSNPRDGDTARVNDALFLYVVDAEEEETGWVQIGSGTSALDVAVEVNKKNNERWRFLLNALSAVAPELSENPDFAELSRLVRPSFHGDGDD